MHVNMHTHRGDAGWAEVSLTALFLGAEGMNDLTARVSGRAYAQDQREVMARTQREVCARTCSET